MDDEQTTMGTACRGVAAAAITVMGLIHLQLYFDGYRDVPDANLGRSFLANATASAVIAVALVVRRDRIVRLAGIVLSAATLVAFAMSRRGDGIFGFTETGLEPSPQAPMTLVSGGVAIVALAATFIPRIGTGSLPPRRIALGIAAAIVLASAVMAPVWSGDDIATVDRDGTETVPEASGSGSNAVSIDAFAFAPAALSVDAGATVTWTNAEGAAHSVSARDGSFESDRLEQGGTFVHTFDAAGEFTYICGIHPFMTGTVSVPG